MGQQYPRNWYGPDSGRWLVQGAYLRRVRLDWIAFNISNGYRGQHNRRETIWNDWSKWAAKVKVNQISS